MSKSNESVKRAERDKVQAKKESLAKIRKENT
jgi:hypothetical protein